MVAEAARLADWLLELTETFGDNISLRVIDPQSPEGLVKSIRYWVRKYPAFILDGRQRIIGWDHEALFAAINTLLKHRTTSHKRKINTR